MVGCMVVYRIKVEYNEKSGTFMAVKDYGDDLGYLEEIGSGETPAAAVMDLLAQSNRYDTDAYRA